MLVAARYAHTRSVFFTGDLSPDAVFAVDPVDGIVAEVYARKVVVVVHSHNPLSEIRIRRPNREDVIRGVSAISRR
jgi:hypothetical protein